MLGYNVQAGDFLPYLTFNAKHGYWSRKQDDQVVRMDAAMTGVFDFAKFKCGWVKFQEGQAPDMRLTDYGAPPLPHPEADMPKDYKKTFKLGFKVSVVLPDGLGAHEFASNSVGVVAQVNKILEQYNAAPESKAGKLPVVNCKDIVMFRSGKNENPAPVLEIVAWVDRPASLDDVSASEPAPAAAPATPPSTGSTPVPPPAAPAAGGSLNFG